VRGAAPTEGLLAWGLILAVGLALAWLVPLVLGNVGPVTDARDPSLPSALRTPGPVITAVAAIALVGLAGLAGPVVAGAARAPDASQAALVTLWARWVTGLSGAVGVLLLLAGVAEHLIMRRSLWQDLHMTSDQARDRARRHGGTRG
jgi:hypothetical protein